MPALKILNNPMKTSLATFITLSSIALANDPPTVVVQSAEMRPSTTLMDVVYRVNDPDDSTVKVRALAFVDGVRSFANILRPVTFVEGTDIMIGDAIPTNVDHRLTWDVAADWNIDLGEVVFEVLAVDSNGMLPFDGITIPAAAGEPELQINKIGISDEETYDALLWLYASGDANMEVVNGILQGSGNSGIFEQYPVVVGDTLDPRYAQKFLSKLMGNAWTGLAGLEELEYAEIATRSEFPRDQWLTTNRPYAGSELLLAWGADYWGQTNVPNLNPVHDIISVATSGGCSFALKRDGTIVAWGYNGKGQTDVPPELAGVLEISAGPEHCLALKSDGTLVGWGANDYGESTIPAEYTGVVFTAIATSYRASIALKADGQVIAWGSSENGIRMIPSEARSNVIAISGGFNNALALKSDGTVVGWGRNNGGEVDIPAGLSDVTAISCGGSHSLALKSDGTVVAWGQSTVPPGLSGVTAIGASHSSGASYALRNDGSIIAWGSNNYGLATIAAELSGVTLFAAGDGHCIAVAKVP